MTVCRYYLQGTCRFGNRCRFEHTDPDSYSNSNDSSRRNDYGYQDRYKTQENYQHRSNKYENQDLSFGPRRYNYYEQANQNYRSGKYYQNDDYEYYSSPSYRNDTYDRSYHKEDYGRSTSNQRYSSSERQSANSRYDNSYQKSQFKPNDYSKKYDKNQYEWVSEDHKKQHQRKEHTHHDSSTTFSFKSLDGDKNEKIKEESLILAERIKEDIIIWELGNYWPFTCYNPFTKKGGFPGFKDFSFEELRYESLKAKQSNTFGYFVENIAKSIIDVQNKRNKLKEPTDDVLSMIQKLKAGEDLSETSENESGFPLMNFTQGAFEDIADETPLNTQSAMSASSFSFKDEPVKNTSFSFKAILDQNSHAQSSVSASSFSFKVPDTNKLPSGVFSSKETDSDFPMYTPVEQLSEQDKEQFSASTFTLGKIPTVPPPKVFCF